MRLGEVGKGTWVGRGVQLEFSGWARGVVRGMVRREDFFFFFPGVERGSGVEMLLLFVGAEQ